MLMIRSLALAVGDIGRAVTDGLPATHHATLEDLRARLDHRPNVARAFRALDAAVERDARASQIEGERVARKNAGTVGDAEAPCADALRHLPEDYRLDHVELVPILVRAGEMAHQRLDLEAFEEIGLHVVRIEAETVHARVDHDIARPAIGRLPARDLLGTVQYRAGGRAESEGHVGLTNAMKHRERCATEMRQNFGRFFPRGDEEVAATRCLEMLHRLDRAQTISIGLDRCTAGGRPLRRASHSQFALSAALSS